MTDPTCCTPASQTGAPRPAIEPAPTAECNACDGIRTLTPRPVSNRPGLDALRYRIGNHGDFFESMLARISSLQGPPVDASTGPREYLLRDRLTTRDPNDPSIALLDAWAVVADIITFYQERIANEGFLRTAIERLSLQELSRLVGYAPRPGLSAAALLAYEVDPPVTQPGAPASAPGRRPANGTSSRAVTIPRGTKSKSTPRPGADEQPQTFETSEDLLARPEWNAIRPRLTRPHLITLAGEGHVLDIEKLYFRKTGLRLSANDYLAIVPTPDSEPVLRQIEKVDEDRENDQTIATLFLDDLSVAKLLKELKAISDTFEAIPTLDPDDHIPLQAEFRRRLKDTLTTINACALDRNSLTIVDDTFHELACDADSAARDLTRSIDAVAGPTYPSLATLLQTDHVGQQFRDAVVALLASHQEDDTLASDVEFNLNEAVTSGMPNVARTIAAIRDGVRRIAEASEAIGIGADPRPVRPVMNDMSAGLGTLEIITAANDLPPDTVALIRVVRGDDSPLDLDAASNFQVAPLFDPYAFILSSRSAGTRPGVIEFRDALRSLKWGDDHERDVVVALATTDPSLHPMPYRAIGTVLQRKAIAGAAYFVPQDGTTPLTVRSQKSFLDFGIEIHDLPAGDREYLIRITLIPQDGLPGTIEDPRITNWHFQSGVTPRPPWDAAGCDTYTLQATDDMTVGDLNDALKAITFTAPSTEGIVGVLIEVSDTAGLVDYASCIHEFCVTRNPPGSLLNALARFHRLLGNPLGNIQRIHDQYLLDVWPNRPPNSDFDECNIRIAAVKLDFENPANEHTLAELATSVEDLFQYVAPRLSPAGTTWGDRIRELEALSTMAAGDALNQSVDSLLYLCLLAFHWMDTPSLREVLTDQRIQEWKDRLEALHTRLANAGNSLGELISAARDVDEDAKFFDERALDLIGVGADISEALSQLADAILAALATRRKALIRAVRTAVTQFGAEILNSSPPAGSLEEQVRIWLEKLLTSIGIEEQLRKPAKELCLICSNPICDASCPKVSCLTDSVNRQLNGAAQPVNSSLGVQNLASAVRLWPPAIRGPFEALTMRLAAIIERVNPKEAPADEARFDRITDINRAFALLGQLRAGRAQQADLLADLLRLFETQSDLVIHLANSLGGEDRDLLFEVLAANRIDEPSLRPAVYAFRGRANIFGWNGPTNLDDLINKLKVSSGLPADEELVVDGARQEKRAKAVLTGEAVVVDLTSIASNESEEEREDKVFLDGDYPKTGRGSVIAIRRRNEEPFALRVLSAVQRPRAARGLKGNTTELQVDPTWWPQRVIAALPDLALLTDLIQSTRVLCDSEELELAEAPIKPETMERTDTIECGEFLPGLSAGKRVVFEGKQDVGTAAVDTPQTETFSLLTVMHVIDRELYGDKFVTEITLDRPLTRDYRRSTVRIYANVVEATHGETRQETLGNGAGEKIFQRFAVRGQPVTYLPAPTASGAESTLAVRVNDVRWKEQKELDQSKPIDRDYLTMIDDSQQSTVIFGDGRNGARPPTGVENVRADYRIGLGKVGNVRARQISQVIGAPLGVKGVVNPLEAVGGADRDGADQIRSRAPLAVTAMERLVSPQDYADFALSFAGVGKADVTVLGGVVHLTVAGMEPGPVDPEGPLFRNLSYALRLHGDPQQQFRLHNRSLALLLIVAKVRIEPERRWEVVEREMRRAFYDWFSYERSELGQDMLLSDAIRVAQSVEGVVYVDIDRFGAVQESDKRDSDSVLGDIANRLKNTDAAMRIPVHPARQTGRGIQPAEICYLTPDIPNTLLLEEIR